MSAESTGRVRPGDVWSALARRRFIVSWWPWRSLAYLASTVPVGVAVLTVFVLLVGLGVLTAVLLVGLALLVGAVLLGTRVGELERRRLRLVDPAGVADPHRPLVQPGLRAWLKTRLREPAIWREFAYTVVLSTVLWPVDMVLVSVCVPGIVLVTGAPLWLYLSPDTTYEFGPWTVADPHDAWLLTPVGLVLAVLSAYLLAVVAGAQAALARYLLAPGVEEVLGVELAEMGRSRSRLVDAFEAERRRIERDLHDGAQQRLVAVAMNLGEAQLHTPADAPAALPLAQAREQASKALSELRELIRNVHPKVLGDHGLTAALTDVADRCVVPVHVTVNLPGRLPAPIESAAYFAACEALTNVDKHSRATHADVECRLDRDTLVLRLTDDGVGGADPTAGSGLAGLADRLAVLGGTLSISSPVGGPTVLHMEIPCDRNQS